ncbi:ABC transporter permease [Skermania piniformis]|uniref:ABC transporter permease n=1 Tax=Skermania pinensis TaxID=39122 RepID=A0ABX8S672_9ACTN|nr:ABC transporter permease [Skermania piniformis]QXQ13343.1 ABC transporter permease [Skermania piniformis]
MTTTRTAGVRTVAGSLRRSVRSELAKLSGRSSVWLVVIPLALIIPLGLNVGIAAAAEANAFDGAGGMDTDNAAYWILVFSTFILMSAAVTALCAEYKDKTIDTVFAIAPRRALLPVAKLIVFGAIGAVAAGVITFLILWGIPQLFPTIWGRVDVWSAAGVRLLICVPIYTVLVTAAGLGLSALVPKPGLVVMIVLLWKFGIEVFATFVPGDLGLLLQRLAPFKNGELGAGQMTTIESPFGGPNGSLAYFAALCLAVFVLGTVRMTRVDPRGE